MAICSLSLRPFFHYGVDSASEYSLTYRPRGAGAGHDRIGWDFGCRRRSKARAMFEVVVLTCSLALAPNQCMVENATQVIRGQASFASAALCEENARRLRRLPPLKSRERADQDRLYRENQLTEPRIYVAGWQDSRWSTALELSLWPTLETLRTIHILISPRRGRLLAKRASG